VFEYRHDAVVLSVHVLLRPEADSPQRDGVLQRGLPNEAPVSTLRYEVIRVWQLPVEQLLTGGFGTLALAPISNVPKGQAREVVRRINERLSGPKAPRRAKDILAATYVLLGLRYSDDFAYALFEEVLGMEESATYQAIMRRGRAEEARRMLLLAGETKFGPADAATQAALEALDDLRQLEELMVRFVNAESWQELLPPSRQRKSRRKTEG